MQHRFIIILQGYLRFMIVIGIFFSLEATNLRIMGDDLPTVLPYLFLDNSGTR